MVSVPSSRGTPASLSDFTMAWRTGLLRDGTIGARRMQHIMNDFVLAFFEQYLNNTGTGIDKPLRDRYPEVLDVDVSHVKEWAASDPKPIFMSHTHVFKMNRLLAASSEVEAETAKLDRRYVMAIARAAMALVLECTQAMVSESQGSRSSSSLNPPQRSKRISLPR